MKTREERPHLRTSGLLRSLFWVSITSPLPGNGGLDNAKQDNTQQEAEEGGASVKNKHLKQISRNT